MADNVLVIAESWRGEISGATFELLALGRELADALGGKLDVLLAGQGVSGLAGELGAADGVYLADAPALAEPEADGCSRLVANVLETDGPRYVLVPLTNASWDTVGLLPARIGAPLVNFCRDITVAAGNVEATCVLYGGKMEATVRVAASPAVFGVLPGARPADAGRVPGSPEVKELAFDAKAALVFLRYVEPEAGDVDIAQQDALVSVGRGLQGEANLDLAEELAEILGGAVCGSRPAVDQGWLPLSRQVGKSGITVKPKVYFALGISGAPEHVEGMRDSELIIAINTDPDAPIFNTAHFGSTEDLLDVVPALIDKASEVKGG
jgi:electron transfer flavoprotein alpha subunit